WRLNAKSTKRFAVFTVHWGCRLKLNQLSGACYLIVDHHLTFLNEQKQRMLIGNAQLHCAFICQLDIPNIDWGKRLCRAQLLINLPSYQPKLTDLPTTAQIKDGQRRNVST